MSLRSYDCPTCGTVEMEMPVDAADAAILSCPCKRFLGTWGNLLTQLLQRAGTGSASERREKSR
jgi:hypothetical protein